MQEMCSLSHTHIHTHSHFCTPVLNCEQQHDTILTSGTPNTPLAVKLLGKRLSCLVIVAPHGLKLLHDGHSNLR